MKTKYTQIGVPQLKPKDIIINYLDDQIQKHMEFECMPENDDGYYFVSRSNIGKIVDGLIPLVKSNYKMKSPDREEEMREMLEKLRIEIGRFESESNNSAEQFELSEMPNSSMCSKAMARAYNTCSNKIDSLLQSLKQA